MIKAKITFISDFHIGSGLGAVYYVDSLFVRDNSHRPYIPGETIKGIIRDSCTRIANSLDIPCEDKRGCKCIICELFGREGKAGKLIFSPAYMNSAQESTDSLVRKRTSINRETGTAKEHALFSSEVAFMGSELHFAIRNRNGEMTELQKALLMAGILWTREIGGNRRRGLGHCRMSIVGNEVTKVTDLPTFLKQNLSKTRTEVANA